MYGGLVLLDTKVLESSTAQDIGRRLANIPLTQFSLLSKYQLTDKLALGGVATYGGEVYAGHLAANAQNNHTVDWWRFDAFAEYELTEERRDRALRSQPHQRALLRRDLPGAGRARRDEQRITELSRSSPLVAPATPLSSGSTDPPSSVRPLPEPPGASASGGF